ncbi:hypothetical protein F6477_16380 [Photobacterium damselae subsp. damselae]|uniref:hypothetical protein n=1 Tax=Photobacterium damselae TaxID=38293 RepID=UPI001248EE58|nr:hypothetical protein [Photobacterium damselae]KAB1176913.1 hypothetical protein F6477_16380 [Photobacterium damselae subsp. damselae]
MQLFQHYLEHRPDVSAVARFLVIANQHGLQLTKPHAIGAELPFFVAGILLDWVCPTVFKEIPEHLRSIEIERVYIKSALFRLDVASICRQLQG